MRDDADDALDALASELYMIASGAARAHGAAHLAFAISPIVERLLRRLLIDPVLREFPWDRVHVWLVDERWNAGGAGDVGGAAAEGACATEGYGEKGLLLREWLVGHSGIPESHVHTFTRGTAGEDMALSARRMDDEARAALVWRSRGQERMDAWIAGVDAMEAAAGWGDGMVLAPDRADGAGGLVLADACGEGAVARCAMTRGMAARSEFVGILATGEASRPMVRAWASRTRPAPIVPIAGELRWYLDRDACPRDGGRDASAD